jgi:hypothetical protein
MSCTILPNGGLAPFGGSGSHSFPPDYGALSNKVQRVGSAFFTASRNLSPL